MYGGPPMPGRGAQYPTPPPGGPALGFDNLASQPAMGTPGVSIGNQGPKCSILYCLIIKSLTDLHALLKCLDI